MNENMVYVGEKAGLEFADATICLFSVKEAEWMKTARIGDKYPCLKNTASSQPLIKENKEIIRFPEC